MGILNLVGVLGQRCHSLSREDLGWGIETPSAARECIWDGICVWFILHPSHQQEHYDNFPTQAEYQTHDYQLTSGYDTFIHCFHMPWLPIRLTIKSQTPMPKKANLCLVSVFI